MRTARGFWLSVALSTSLVSSAFGQTPQPWLSDRRYGEGPGIRAGSVEIHPGVAAEIGYDSNFFQAAGADPDPLISEPTVPAYRLQVTPSLRLRTLGPQRTEGDGAEAAAPGTTFSTGASLRINRLFPVDENAPEEAGSQNFLTGNLDTVIDILPSAPWGALLYGSVTRTEQPGNDPALPNAVLDRTRAGGGFDLRWRPGGGVLQWSLGYGGFVTRYDSNLVTLDHAEHGLRTRGRWRFLPRTALIYEGQVGFIRRLHTESRQTDASPISSQLGINGLITSRLALLAMGGFKAMFFEPIAGQIYDDFDGVIGRLEATWYLGASDAPDLDGPSDVGLSRVRAGFVRDVFPSGIGNYYQLNRVFLDAGSVFGGVFTLTGTAGVSIILHPTPRSVDGIPLTANAESITEWRPDLGLFGEYRLTTTIGLVGSLEFTASPVDNFLLIDTTSGAQDNLSFTRFVALFGARWFL